MKIPLVLRNKLFTRFFGLSFATISLVLGIGCNAPAGKSHYILAERLFSDQKYSASVEEFKKIIDSDPRGSLAQQALFRIATIQHLYLEKYREAVETYKKFVVVSQNNKLVYQAEKTIGDIYFSKLEDYKLSAEQYNRLLEKYPESSERDFFLVRLAKSYYGALEFQKAIAMYRRIFQEYPKSPYAAEGLYQIGNTLYTKGKIDEAIEAFEEVSLFYPKSQQSIFAQFGIGNCLEEKNRTAEALEVYLKILDKHPAKKVVSAKIKRLQEKQERETKRH